MTDSSTRCEWAYRVSPLTVAPWGLGTVCAVHWMVVSIANLNSLAVHADVLSPGEVDAARARMIAMLVSWAMIFFGCIGAMIVLYARMRNGYMRWDIPTGKITAMDILGRQIGFDVKDVNRIVILHRGRSQLAAFVAVISMSSRRVVVPAGLVTGFGSLTERLGETSLFTREERPGLLGAVVRFTKSSL